MTPKITSPAVITSKAAQKDVADITTKHADIMAELANHTVRVQGVQQQRAAQMQANQAMQVGMQKDKAAADSEAQNTAIDFALRQAEIDIKRSALAMK